MLTCLDRSRFGDRVTVECVSDGKLLARKVISREVLTWKFRSWYYINLRVFFLLLLKHKNCLALCSSIFFTDYFFHRGQRRHVDIRVKFRDFFNQILFEVNCRVKRDFFNLRRLRGRVISKRRIRDKVHLSFSFLLLNLPHLQFIALVTSTAPRSNPIIFHHIICLKSNVL